MSEAARPEEGTYVSQLADLLVWGVRTGWNLLGRPINIRLTESDLGYTHPPSRGTPQAIYVNPKVLLEAGGFKVMQGLILHELGHHFAHFSDPRYKVVFGRCKADRMARMLNIIEDEHLERRLRGLDPEWGECLDALASYAFKGKPLELLIEKFAALHRESTLAEVIEALARGEIPGKVLKWEFGYELGAEIGRWVRGAELVDLVTAALTAAAPGGKLPAMVAEKMAEIRKEAASEWVRTGPLGVLDIMEDEPIFQRGRAGQESQARIHVSVALEATAEEQDDPSGYLDRIKRDIRPLLEDFPQLERFLKEVEASLGTKWFWQKQRSMLFMMRHRRDFTHAFLPAAEMSSKHFLHIFGKMAFHPGVILSRLVMRWQPRHLESREHPLKVAVSWLEMLDSPLTSDTLRFLVSLRLGLGNRGAGGREPVISALGAVPKNLRKLDMTGLEKVTREVAACLGECCLDPRRSRDSTVEEGEPGAPPTDGATLGEIQQGQMDELTSPLTPEEEKEQKGDLLKATEEAQKRIDEWLRTGIDPRNIGQKEKKGIRRGSQSRGVIRTEGSPSGKDKGQGLASLDWDFVNVADTLGFSIIEEIALPPPANDLQKRYAASVRGPVRAMRRFLLTLGQKDLETFGARQGRRLDPGRVRRLATVNDPGVVVGRELTLSPDLFLGLCIDCSGSMAHAEHMDKALSFATLLLEAARGLKGIETRALGFEDKVLWDGGTAEQPRVAGFQPGAGNNDAAGLLAMAQQAVRSKKKHHLLVMISDGFPTDCSLDSLTGLVKVLDRKYAIKSVQVAVAEMESDRVAFPDFTDLSLYEIPLAVRFFGRMLQRVLLKQYA